MLKRIVGLVVGTTVACSSFMAFATVNTTTEYGDEAGKVNVKSVITGDFSIGDTFTYLATVQGAELASLKGEQIVYIDQVTLTENATTYDFTYTADAEKAILANVKVGGALSASETDVAGPVCAVKVNGTETGVVVEHGTEADNLVSVPYANVAIVDTVKINNEPVEYTVGAGSIMIKASNFLGKNSVDVIVTDKEVSPDSAVVTTTGMAALIDGDDDDVSGNETYSVILVGELTGFNNDFGIKVKVGGGKVQTLKAYGVGDDGKYAVKLTGLDPDIVVEACTYVAGNVGDTWTVTTGKEVRGNKVVAD